MTGQRAIRMRNKRSAVGLCVIILGSAGYFGMRFVRVCKIPLTFSVVLPSFVSDRAHQEILAACQTYTRASLFSYHGQLMREFPYLSTLELSFKQDNSVVLIADVSDPVYVINDTQLLLDNNTIVSTHVYKRWRYKSVPKINIISDALDSFGQADIQAVRAYQPLLSSGLFDLVWIDLTDAFLTGSELSDLIIRCNSFSVPSFERINQCRSLYEQYLETVKKTKKKVRMIADIRFEKQIILYADTEGGLNGSIIVP